MGIQTVAEVARLWHVVDGSSKLWRVQLQSLAANTQTQSELDRAIMAISRRAANVDVGQQCRGETSAGKRRSVGLPLTEPGDRSTLHGGDFPDRLQFCEHQHFRAWRILELFRRHDC